MWKTGVTSTGSLFCFCLPLTVLEKAKCKEREQSSGSLAGPAQLDSQVPEAPQVMEQEMKRRWAASVAEKRPGFQKLLGGCGR